MEAVLNNLTGAAELLAVARTDAVRRWDARALHRAFQWTRYCQRVHSRFRDKRAIRAAMERRLRAANDGLRAAAYFPGHADVTFADLSRCERALLAALLGNPALPRAALGSLLLVAGSSPDVGTGENGDGDAAGHCAQLIACKSACEVLRAARAKTAAFPGGDAEVQGVMLMETLDALLGGGGEEEEEEGRRRGGGEGRRGGWGEEGRRRGGGEGRRGGGGEEDEEETGVGEGGGRRGEGGRGGEHAAQELLESMLQKSEEEDNVVLVIASALRRKSSATAGGASRGFLLNWLLQNDQMLQKICSRLPAEDMMSQVKDSEDFRAAYCDVLRRWVSDMTFDIQGGEWRPAGTTAGVSFKTLTRHFRALFETLSPLLREDVETDLKARKMADGDFDVEGLSVWGDLLAALAK